MENLTNLNKEELAKTKAELLKKYKDYQNLNLNLNMTRGKPSKEQLALSMPLLDVLNSSSDCTDAYGTDCRNYGELLGIKEARKLFGELLGTSIEETIVVGQSSFNFMYELMAMAMLKGTLGSDKPWSKYDKVKFLCPVPGYDRHFAICEFLGIEMINIPLTEDGPDMDLVAKYASSDESVKGIWCVPKYSNPLGVCYSDETIKRLANLKPAAKDFRIFWDNAYSVHAIYKDIQILNILDECKKAGNPNMVYMFGSTSKMTLPGAGVGYFGASKENVEYIENQLKCVCISYDKMNMLRHVRYLKDIDNIKGIMAKQADILRPKFDAVLNTLDEELGNSGAGSWVKPGGGYFVTYVGKKGTAKRIHALCKDAGVLLTEPGSTHPYHKDPDDSYLRLAPSFPSLDDVKMAMKVFCVAAQIATIETLE